MPGKRAGTRRTPERTLQFLFGLQRFGIKKGLRTERLLLQSLGHPERSYPVIHIAGTNGKGSTSSMLASVLSAAGFRTGLYTSPHLVDFTERIRVDGRPMEQAALVKGIAAIARLVRHTEATFFEATTAIAFDYFRSMKVDVAVIETGLGGRLDATNVVHPLLSVITNIGLDHREHLGTTIAAIAREKGGIIKPRTPIVTGALHPDAERVLRAIAKRRSAPFFNAVEEIEIVPERVAPGGSILEARSRAMELRNLKLELAGSYQLENLSTVLSTLNHLPPFLKSKIGEKAIRRGLANVRNLSGLRGRLELLSGHPPMILDVAHNPPGVAAAFHAMRELVPGRLLVVFGVMSDKEFRPMVDVISQYARLIVATRPSTPRALAGSEIVRHFQGRGIRAIDGGEVSRAIELACRERREREPILIIGSHYLAGEALEFLEKKKGKT